MKPKVKQTAEQTSEKTQRDEKLQEKKEAECDPVDRQKSRTAKKKQNKGKK